MLKDFVFFPLFIHSATKKIPIMVTRFTHYGLLLVNYKIIVMLTKLSTNRLTSSCVLFIYLCFFSLIQFKYLHPMGYYLDWTILLCILFIFKNVSLYYLVMRKHTDCTMDNRHYQCLLSIYRFVRSEKTKFILKHELFFVIQFHMKKKIWMNLWMISANRFWNIPYIHTPGWATTTKEKFYESKFLKTNDYNSKHV
mgnify:CR=1 FL=1